MLGLCGMAQAVPVTGQGTWETTLQGRDLDGDPTTYEAYYDTVLDITWLADAKLGESNTFGLATDTDLGTYPQDSSSVHGLIGPDGTMNWPGARFLIDAMNASNGGAGYLGFSDWRLPTIVDTGSPGCDFSYSGTDCGYNVDTSTSELASLWYDTLGNIPFSIPAAMAPRAAGG